MPVKLTPLSAPVRKPRDQPHKRFARAPVAPRRVAVEPADSNDKSPAVGGALAKAVRQSVSQSLPPSYQRSTWSTCIHARS